MKKVLGIIILGSVCIGFVTFFGLVFGFINLLLAIIATSVFTVIIYFGLKLIGIDDD